MIDIPPKFDGIGIDAFHYTKIVRDDNLRNRIVTIVT